jgi:hypothetical protein
VIDVVLEREASTEESQAIDISVYTVTCMSSVSSRDRGENNCILECDSYNCSLIEDMLITSIDIFRLALSHRGSG